MPQTNSDRDPDLPPGTEPDKAPEAEIQGLMAMLSGILSNFPTPFFTVDPNLRITYVNPLFEKLTGYSSNEMVNRLTCAEVLSTPNCNTHGCLMQRVMETGSPIVGVRSVVVDRQGRAIPVVVNASIITDADNRIIGGFEAIRDITPVVEAENKIRMLTEMTNEGIVLVDDSNRIIFANSKMGEIVGFSKERLIGMDAGEILSPEKQHMLTDLMKTYDPEHPQQLSFCSSVEPFGSLSEQHSAMETCIAVTGTGKKIIGCLCFRDVTRHLETARQIRKANTFLENIIRSSVEGIIVVDTSGNVLIFNEGAERILGYRADEVVGHPEVFAELYEPAVARENMRKMRSDQYGPPGKLNSTRIYLRARNGEEVPVNFSAAIIKEGDQEIASVGIFSDRRENMMIRKELEQARMQLLQAEKIASLGRLAAGVAHEINNPLAGILIYADMLIRDMEINPQWKQDLQEIIDQTLRCKEIVNRLLEFSRQPLGQRVYYNVKDVIDRCIGLLGRQSLFHDVEFRLNLEPDLPQINGDPAQIQQVFTNIIINAAIAMGGKGILSISGTFDKRPGMVVVSFTDNGPGIPKGIIDKVFEPFFTTKRPGEGTGLGLSVAYGIVQEHGGVIGVRNAEAGGAVFTVSLPLESPEHIIDSPGF